MEKSSSENDSAYSQSLGKEMNLGFKDRLQEIEKDLSTIFERLDKVEEGYTEGMQGRPTDSYKMLVKINSLEGEKRDLKDESFALRLEIADLKEIIGKNLENKLDKNGENFRKKDGNTMQVDKNNFRIPRDDRRSSLYNSDSDCLVEANPWQFPKRTAKSRQCPEMFVKTQNRFSGLGKSSENYASSNDNAYAEITIPQSFSDKPLEYVERNRAQNQSEKSTSPKKNIRNVVPGELSFAEATAAKPRTTNGNNRSSPNKKVTLQSNSQVKSRIQEPFEDRKKPVITVVGDSIVRGIGKQEINRTVHKYNSFVKTFPGATTEDMESYIIPTLKRNPDVLIIHCGTNDLRKEDPGKIATKITRVALQAKKTVQKVAVSSILARGDSDHLERKRVQVNMMLQKSLADNEIDLIEHEVFDTDWRHLLYDDGIHLNDDGTNVLGNDFVNYINSI